MGKYLLQCYSVHHEPHIKSSELSNLFYPALWNMIITKNQLPCLESNSSELFTTLIHRIHCAFGVNKAERRAHTLQIRYLKKLPHCPWTYIPCRCKCMFCCCWCNSTTDSIAEPKTVVFRYMFAICREKVPNKSLQLCTNCLE
jgi:hypothetical protein